MTSSLHFVKVAEHNLKIMSRYHSLRCHLRLVAGLKLKFGTDKIYL